MGRRRGIGAYRGVSGDADSRSIELAPHRIDGYDNVYDYLAEAVHLYGLSSRDRDVRLRLFRKLLALYGECGFESRLKSALLRSDMIELLDEAKAALRRSLALAKPYLASQLLPVIARWRTEDALALTPVILAERGGVPNPAVNVAEALRYVPYGASGPLLAALAQDDDSVVADEARRSLASFNRQSGSRRSGMAIPRRPFSFRALDKIGRVGVFA